MVMGWQQHSNTPGRVFGVVVDTIIRQAPCDVVLLRPSSQASEQQRWLIPVAGGPNVRRALDLLPGLVSLQADTDIRLCHVSPKRPSPSVLRYLDQIATRLGTQIKGTIQSIALRNPQTAEAILDIARWEQRDTILLGASREGLLSQVLNGNIPVLIAQNPNFTVILVRRVSHFEDGEG